MAKIYELTEQQNEILDQLFWLDDQDEEDAAKIELLKKELLKIRGSAESTLEFLSKILLESRAILAAREESKRCSERRRKAAEKNVERLTNVCEHIMSKFDIKKISLEECDITLQMGPPGLEYAPNFDPSSLPTDCYKLEYKPIAKEIKARIDDGEQFEGIMLVRRESLRVR